MIPHDLSSSPHISSQMIPHDSSSSPHNSFQTTPHDSSSSPHNSSQTTPHDSSSSPHNSSQSTPHDSSSSPHNSSQSTPHDSSSSPHISSPQMNPHNSPSLSPPSLSQLISSSKSTFMAHLQLSHLHFAPCSHNGQLVQGSSGTFLQWEVGHLQYRVKGLDTQKKPRFVKACIYHSQERLYSAFKCGPHGDEIQSHQSDVSVEEQKTDWKLLQRNGQTCSVLLILAEMQHFHTGLGLYKLKGFFSQATAPSGERRQQQQQQQNANGSMAISLTCTENNSDKKHFLPEVLCPWLAFHPSTRVWSSHADTAWPGCQTQFLHGPVNKMTSLLHLLPSKLFKHPLNPQESLQSYFSRNQHLVSHVTAWTMWSVCFSVHQHTPCRTPQ